MSDEQNTSKSQLINELQSVTSTSNDVSFLNFDIKKEKKKKKKSKKKESNISLLINGQYVDLSDSPITESDHTEENHENTIDTLNLIDSDAIFFGDDDDDDEFVGIVKTQKGGYNKLKSDDNIYKKEFSEELVLLYNLLDELNSFDKKLNRKVEGLDSTKARGMSKYTNDLIQSLLTCKTNKLQVLKEISNIKKTIVDLKMKDQKNNKSDSENSPEIMASSYLNQILGMGRNKFLKSLNNVDNSSNMTNGLNFEEDDDFDELLDSKLESGTGRSDELEKYVQYESLEPKICVKKFIDTGDWEFIVMDKFNREIPDYPTPNPETVIPMKFGDDGVMATDKHGRSYKVIEVISGEDVCFESDGFDE